MTIILALTALVVGVACVLANGGSAHAMSQSRCSANTSPGPAGTLFRAGIVVG